MKPFKRHASTKATATHIIDLSGQILLLNETLCSLKAPEDKTHLDLSRTRLHHYHSEDVIMVMTHLPKSITALNLGFNRLNQLPHQVLMQWIAHMPHQVTTLDLSGNRLNRLKANDFIAFLGAVSNLKVLDLSWNDLYLYDIKTLMQAFEALPDTVHQIILSHNLLDHLSLQDAYCVFSSFKNKDIVLQLDEMRVPLNSYLEQLEKTKNKHNHQKPHEITTYGLFSAPKRLRLPNLDPGSFVQTSKTEPRT